MKNCDHPPEDDRATATDKSDHDREEPETERRKRYLLLREDLAGRGSCDCGMGERLNHGDRISSLRK
jgi:hypothetical protein